MGLCVSISRPLSKIYQKTSFLIGILAMSLAPCSGAYAAETRSGGFDFDPNYSYAAYLGTGIYKTATGDSLGVLNIPIAFPILRPHEERSWGMDFKVPVSIGFFNYDFEDDLPSGELPTSFDTVTVLPGVEFRVPMTETWSLHPFIDVGAGRNFGTDTTNAIYGLGFKSFFAFNLATRPFLLGNRLYHAGYRNLDNDQYDAFTGLETGLHMPVIGTGTHFNRKTDFAVYYQNFIYSENLLISNDKGQLDSYNIQNEIGFTWGATQIRKNTLYQQPRIGFGVRVTRSATIYRLVFGMPFF